MEEVDGSNPSRSTKTKPNKTWTYESACALPHRGRGHAESIWSPNSPKFGLQPADLNVMGFPLELPRRGKMVLPMHHAAESATPARNRLDHILPRSYLEGFTNPQGQLSVFD